MNFEKRKTKRCDKDMSTTSQWNKQHHIQESLKQFFKEKKMWFSDNTFFCIFNDCEWTINKVVQWAQKMGRLETMFSRDDFSSVKIVMSCWNSELFSHCLLTNFFEMLSFQSGIKNTLKLAMPSFLLHDNPKEVFERFMTKSELFMTAWKA